MHTCPRKGCDIRLPDRLFACRFDWYALSRDARRAIWGTVGLPITDPLRALAWTMALKEWRALDKEKEETE